MPNPSLFQKSLAKGYSMYSDDVGKALIHMGTIGWTFSALAQIVMIAKNDKINQKDKKFLIPQEIADGVVNVGLYYTICMGLKKYCDKLCESGKIISESSDKVLGKIKGDHQTVQAYIKGMSRDLFRNNLIKKNEKKTPLTAIFNALIQDFDNVKILKKKKIDIKDSYFFNRNPIFKNNADKEKLLEVVKKAQSEFKINKNAIGVIATITGSVLACNLITPVCRNLVANQFQKKYIKNKPRTFQPMSLTSTFNTFKI